MFNFSANHLTLLSRTEYRSCAVFMVLDHSTRGVYCLHDFTKAHAMEPGSYYCVSGKVNSAGKLYLVVESVKPDTKHNRSSIALFHLTVRKDDPDGVIKKAGRTRTVRAARTYGSLQRRVDRSQFR